jgi:hypothetical protein
MNAFDLTCVESLPMNTVCLSCIVFPEICSLSPATATVKGHSWGDAERGDEGNWTG